MVSPGAAGPTVQRTRAQLRQSLGYQVGAMYLATATATAGTTGFTDATLTFGTTDEHKGKWLVGTTGGIAGEIHRVVASTTGGVLALTTASPWTSQPPVGAVVEIWDNDLPPTRIHDFLNRAIMDVGRKGAQPNEDFSLHIGRKIYRYTIPAANVGIQKLSFRRKYTGLSLSTGDSAWTSSDATNITAAADTEDFREGAGSARFVLAAAAAAGNIGYVNLSSATNLSRYTHVEFWVKSTVVTAAGDLSFRLSSTSNGGTATDDVSIAALAANTWTYQRLALNNPQSNTAISSIALRQPVDIGAARVWIDGVIVSEANSEVWEELDPMFWFVGQDSREIILSEQAVSQANGYALLRIDGVKLPSLLTAETTNSEVDAEYVLNKALALAYRARADRRGQGYEASMALADKYESIAEQRRARLPSPNGVRWIAQ